MASTPIDIVNGWGKAVGEHKYDEARQFAHPNLAFRGPIDTFARADDLLTSLSKLSAIVKGSEPEGMIAQGNQVALFYMLKTVVADTPVAEWYTIENGKIAQLRAYFDARPYAPAPTPSR